MRDMTLSAAVLAGGQSRRMGQDKALLEFDGRTLLERALATLRVVADDVVIVAQRPEYECFGAPVLADDMPGCGTLGGIATALRAARHAHTLIVACDMPLLSAELLRAMAAEPRDYDVLIPSLAAERSRQGGNETLEPLHAIYATRCLPAIVERLAAGQHKVVEFMRAAALRRLDETWLRRHDPQLASFVNANTIGELDEARRLAATLPPRKEGPGE